MSFFKKALGAVGIGAAKIDTILDDAEVCPGGEISGIIKITGGKTEQDINKIDLDLMCQYTVEREREDSEGEIESYTQTVNHCLNRFKVDESFSIAPGDIKEIPFAIDLSIDAPLSIGRSKTWLSTNLDIDMALDKSDRDYLEVLPTELQGAVIDALYELGLELYEAECEGVEHHVFSPLPFVQELEFKATSGDFRGRLDELEVVFVTREHQLDVIFEIDRRARGFGGFFREITDLDETKARLVVTYDNVESIEEAIYHILENNC